MQVESCNLFPMAPYRALRLPLYSPLTCKATLSSVAPLTLAVSPALRPFRRSRLGPATGLSHSRTYQRQGNLICSPVRKTLTKFNVWSPFILAHVFIHLRVASCAHLCIRRYRLIDVMRPKPPFHFLQRDLENVKREKCEAGEEWRLNEEIVARTSWRYNLVIKFFFGERPSPGITCHCV